MPNNTERVIVVDLEATCWLERNPPEPQSVDIIEIGLCVLDIRSKGVEKPVSIYVRPERSTLSEFCMNLTGITPRNVYKQGVSYSQAISRLITKYGSLNKAWASYGDGDPDMIAKQCSDFGLQYPFSRTYFNVQALLGMKYQMTDQSIGLTRGMGLIGLPFEGKAHSGAVDAYNTALLLGMLLWGERPKNLWEIPPTEEGLDAA